MENPKRFSVILLLILSACISDRQEGPPLAPAEDLTETIFGKTLSDPYRYMEDLTDSTVVNWFKAQADFARSVLNSIPGRKELIDKMMEFDQRRSERVYALQITENDKYFYLKQTPQDETGKLFFRNGYEGEEKLLFDPETYLDDTLQYSISGLSPSRYGSKIAFEISPEGSENSELVIYDMEGGKTCPEKLDHIWGAMVSWLPGEERFFYNKLNSMDVHDPDRIKNTKVYVHQVGTEQEMDKEIFSKAFHPELDISSGEIPAVMYDPDNDYLYAILVSTSPDLKAYYAPITEMGKGKISWNVFIKPEDEIRNFASTEEFIYAYTPRDASNFKLVRTSLTQPDFQNAEIIVPENKNARLDDFMLNKDGIYYTLATNGIKEEFFHLDLRTLESRKIELPVAAGSAWLKSKSIRSSDIWIGVSGWTTNSRRYRYNIRENEFKLEMLSSRAEYPEYQDLVVEELMIPSHDGVEVPLSLVYKKNLEKDSSHPLMLFGYGSYGISMNPFFSPNMLLFTHHNGIFAIAHVRGGGELGDDWHKSGMLDKKPNTWKDFIACAEYLVQEKYTSKEKMACYSGSAGGILLGRAMTDRPDLFSAVIPEVGFMNPTRTENDPLGEIDIPEFGDPSDSLGFLARLAMDSYHHLVKGEIYPATLVTAGMNDPRVIAWQPAKFAARLQAANASDHPVLFWIDYESGHGIGDSKTKQFESLADALGFALWHTGHPDFQAD